MTIFEFLIPYFLHYGELISFLVGFFLGLESVMILAFLGSNGALNPVTLFIFALLGLVLSDSMYFAIGKYRLLNGFRRHIKISEKVHSTFHRITKKNFLFTMLYTRFAYGFSIVTLIYLGFKDISWKKFLVANIGVNIFGAILAMALGWLAGNGYKSILTNFKRVEIGIGFIVLFVIILIFLEKRVNQELEEKIEE